MEYSKSFVTSVVLGKDVVPRIGLHQLEALRHDLIYAVHKSTDPKASRKIFVNFLGLFHLLKKIIIKISIFDIFSLMDKGILL